MKRLLMLCLILTLLLTGTLRAEVNETDNEIGSIVTFGAYEQDNDIANGNEPIEWIVIGKRDDSSLVLISKYALDAKPYNTEWADVTWETCSLRKWLNEDFYNAAFNVEEQARIVPVMLDNEDNPDYGTAGGKATTDKVCLLSVNEVADQFTREKVYSYFTDDTSRKCKPTKYAVARGANYDSTYKTDGIRGSAWWLRSPGYDSCYAAYVDYVGRVHDFGDFDSYGYYSVRPVVVVLPQ